MTVNKGTNLRYGKIAAPQILHLFILGLLLINYALAQIDSLNESVDRDVQASNYHLTNYSLPSTQLRSNQHERFIRPQASLVSSMDRRRIDYVPEKSSVENPVIESTEHPIRARNNLNVDKALSMNRLSPNGISNNVPKSVRHIVASGQAAQRSDSSQNDNNPQMTSNDDICADRLCYGLPKGCAASSIAFYGQTDQQVSSSSSPACSVLMTSKRQINSERLVSRDIIFEMIASPKPKTGSYAAVGFSENGRMQGLVNECLHYRDEKTQLEIIKLKHSYNIPGTYSNVPVSIISGIKELDNIFEDGHFLCRWIAESAVEYSYEADNGSLITRRDDLGYKNYHILLASGEYNDLTEAKGPHTLRSSSLVPVSLAQTGLIKSLGAHILVRIHGSLMIAIWIGFVTLSIILARYYKNEWSSSRLNDLAIWFVSHRALMLAAWFGTVIAIIFAYMYTETYHPGLHQISGTTCLILTTIQVLGGLFRPSQGSSKRIYFNWAHFVCGNLSYLCAMICLVTAAFLAPAHLPSMYIWIIVIFVATYALAHVMLTTHQYISHKSSKISITPMSDLNSNSSTTYTSCGFVADSYPKEVDSPFRQFLLGFLITIIVIFIVLLTSLVNIK